MSSFSEKYCLKWNDFEHNISNSFKELRSDMDFSDVTLVTGEDQHIEANRTVLSACSPFFKAILSKNRHSHPMIYMRGLKAKDLEAAIDFMYTGEANIFQDDLDSFLSLAEELKLKGLTGVKDEDDIVDSVNEIDTSVKSQRY